MTTRKVDVLFNTQSNSSGANETVSALQRIEQQAERTRNKMQKLVQVGQTMGMAGAAIVAPFALALKKYMDTAKETEPTSARLIALSKRWEESQVRIGRVTAEVVLPALEKALDIVDKIAAFTEKNPGFVQSALGIGASLVVLGGLISTTAKIVSTIATVQGLAASMGIGGGGAAIAGGTAGLAGLGTSIAAAISAAAPFVAIAAAVVAAAEATRQILNWAMGTNTTWADIGTTVKQLFVIAGAGWRMVPQQLGLIYGGIASNAVQIVEKLGAIFVNNVNIILTGVGRYFSNTWTAIKSAGMSIISGIGQYISGLASSFVNGLANLGSTIMSGISSLIDKILSVIPGRASGGYMPTGLYRVSEGGRREFALSNRTTRAAEQMIGGTLTQQRLLQALSGGRSANVYQSMRFSGEIGAADKREIRRIARQSAEDGMLAIMGGA